MPRNITTNNKLILAALFLVMSAAETSKAVQGVANGDQNESNEALKLAAVSAASAAGVALVQAAVGIFQKLGGAFQPRAEVVQPAFVEPANLEGENVHGLHKLREQILKQSWIDNDNQVVAGKGDERRSEVKKEKDVTVSHKESLLANKALTVLGKSLTLETKHYPNKSSEVVLSDNTTTLRVNEDENSAASQVATIFQAITLNNDTQAILATFYNNPNFKGVPNNAAFKCYSFNGTLADTPIQFDLGNGALITEVAVSDCFSANISNKIASGEASPEMLLDQTTGNLTISVLPILDKRVFALQNGKFIDASRITNSPTTLSPVTVTEQPTPLPTPATVSPTPATVSPTPLPTPDPVTVSPTPTPTSDQAPSTEQLPLSSPTSSAGGRAKPGAAAMILTGLVTAGFIAQRLDGNEEEKDAPKGR